MTYPLAVAIVEHWCLLISQHNCAHLHPNQHAHIRYAAPERGAYSVLLLQGKNADEARKWIEGWRKGPKGPMQPASTGKSASSAESNGAGTELKSKGVGKVCLHAAAAKKQSCPLETQRKEDFQCYVAIVCLLHTLRIRDAFLRALQLMSGRGAAD